MAGLEVDLGFIQLKNPVMTASGTFGYGEEFAPFMNLDDVGAIIMKGVYMTPRQGNPPPRIYETAAGLLNSIGLAGPGAEGLKPVLKRVAGLTSTPLVVNVCGRDDDEYFRVAEVFDDCPEVSFLELNISCPNVRNNGRCPAQDGDHTARLVSRICKGVKKGVMVKLSPNVADVAEIAYIAQESGASSISLVNTFLGMAVDLERRVPTFKNMVAGLSGPAIKPLALRLVWEVCRRVKIPVVGIGGIMSGKDVLEFIMVGASAIQTGTVNMVEPGASSRIVREIKEEMVHYGITSIQELKGSMTHE